MSHPDPQFDPQITDGLYFNMPDTEYRLLDRLNYSALKDLKESPAVYLFNKRTPRKQTTGMERGSAIHCGLLEPEKFQSKYIATPEKLIGVDRRTKAWLEFEKAVETEGRETLPDGVIECVNAILVKRITLPSGHVVTVREFLKDSKTEVTALGNEPLRGVASKARADIVHSSGIIADLKTTTEAIDKMSFESRMFRRCEHFQAAHYLGVFNDASDDAQFDRFLSLNVKIPEGKYIPGMPFKVAAFMVGEPFIELARSEMGPLIDLYLNRTAIGDWSDDDVVIQPAMPPGWALAAASEESA